MYISQSLIKKHQQAINLLAGINNLQKRKDNLESYIEDTKAIFHSFVLADKKRNRIDTISRAQARLMNRYVKLFETGEL